MPRFWASPGTELVAKLDAGTPRIMVESGTGTRPDQMASTLTVMPYMMDPGEEKIVADALFAGMSKPGRYENPVVPKGAMAQLSGNWAVTIQYYAGRASSISPCSRMAPIFPAARRAKSTRARSPARCRANTLEMVSRMPVPGSSIDWRFKGTGSRQHHVGHGESGRAYGIVPWTAVKA